MLKTVVMCIRGQKMCSTATLTQCMPMPQKLHASKPAVRSLQQAPPPPMPAIAPLVDDFKFVESANDASEEVHSDSSLEMRKDDLEVRQSTQGSDEMACVICCHGSKVDGIFFSFLILGLIVWFASHGRSPMKFRLDPPLL